MVAVVTLALDLAQAAAILFGLAGVVTGVGAFVVNRTTAKTAADTSYVDSNLKVLQSTIDSLVAEIERWQQRYEAQRAAFAAELATVEAELAECQHTCAAAISELQALKGKG